MAKRNRTSQPQTEKAPLRRKVRIPGWNGTHPCGIRFIDGIGYSDDPVALDAAIQHGFEVTNAADDEKSDDDEAKNSESESDDVSTS